MIGLWIETYMSSIHLKYTVCVTFDKIKAALVNIRDFFQNMKETILFQTFAEYITVVT